MTEPANPAFTPAAPDSPDAEAFRAVTGLLATHALWPTPPAAWGRLFAAAVALSELADPVGSDQGPRQAAAARRLMVRLLDRIYWDVPDTRPVRTFLPLVCGRSRLVASAITDASRALLDEGGGPDGAAEMLRVLREDESGRLLAGLTGGIGEAVAEEDRPDLADGLRNPYELAGRLDLIRDGMCERICTLIRSGSEELRLMDRLAAAVALWEASAELRGTGGTPAAVLRVKLTDETVMRVLELLGPDASAVTVPLLQPGERRKRGRPPKPKPIIGDQSPYLALQHIALRSRPLGESLTRIRDHVRSILAGDIVPMGRRRLSQPQDVDRLARTLRRIQTGS
ncbi:hypothetical protein IQ03_03879 [Gemmobacter caeni]|uniref:Uncharacterized protein n=1 Tax=Gemmobacter caeni TaxID=589035 RepID=A0A2T6B9C8_9RHOB|nr:hypothetical protein [Gemmobacter caeni]PTX52664.1 hypothetical protein C8N34_102483 [Gemmobacter caeni]TWI94881.1 hypothetical protein IQ03_03879 [Gemmobacter caeni]